MVKFRTRFRRNKEEIVIQLDYFIEICNQCKTPEQAAKIFGHGLTRSYVIKRISSLNRRGVKVKQFRKLRDKSLEDRFWEKVKIGKPDECWEWQAYKDSKRRGYGHIRVSDKEIVPSPRPVAAHRVSWIINVGPIPKGMNVLHECDNPPCINPNHLFLGTYQDNTDDMIRKGRDRKNPCLGEKNGFAKCTNSRVIYMRDLWDDGDGGYSYKELAAKFGLHEDTIKGIILRRSWTHVK